MASCSTPAVCGEDDRGPALPPLRDGTRRAPACRAQGRWQSRARVHRAPLGVTDGKGVMFVSHTGEIFPAGFLPLVCGRFPHDSVINVYQNHPTFRMLRDPDQFKGICGVCEYRQICGGSRARAYAVTGDPFGRRARLRLRSQAGWPCAAADPADGRLTVSMVPFSSRPARARATLLRSLRLGRRPVACRRSGPDRRRRRSWRAVRPDTSGAEMRPAAGRPRARTRAGFGWGDGSSRTEPRGTPSGGRTPLHAPGAAAGGKTRRKAG